MWRWRETPDWSMPTFSTISFTACSPFRSTSTMRRRVGSASVSNTAVCIIMHMHGSAYKPCSRTAHDTSSSKLYHAPNDLGVTYQLMDLLRDSTSNDPE